MNSENNHTNSRAGNKYIRRGNKVRKARNKEGRKKLNIRLADKRSERIFAWKEKEERYRMRVKISSALHLYPDGTLEKMRVRKWHEHKKGCNTCIYRKEIEEFDEEEKSTIISICERGLKSYKFIGFSEVLCIDFKLE